MNYRDERVRIEMERQAHLKWRSDFSSELIRKVESKVALKLNKTPSEAELKEAEIYNAGKVKRLMDPKFHVISKLVLIPDEALMSQYITLLETANALSDEINRNPGESFLGKLFGGRKKQLAKLDEELELLRVKAQGEINEFIR